MRNRVLHAIATRSRGLAAQSQSAEQRLLGRGANGLSDLADDRGRHLRLLASPKDQAQLAALLTTCTADPESAAGLLLARFGSFRKVVSARADRVAALAGAEVANALTTFRNGMLYFTRSGMLDRPAVSSDPFFLEYLQADMAGLTIEKFRALFLDARMRIVGEHVSEGTLDEAAVYTRELLHRALDLGASGLLLVHNHPSGDLTPSREDIALTRTISDAAHRLRITLYDHIIVVPGDTLSLRNTGHFYA